MSIAGGVAGRLILELVPKEKPDMPSVGHYCACPQSR